MTQELEVVTMHGDYLIDSRLLAARLGYDHKIMLQSLRRHKARLEAKSVLLQIEAKPPRGSLGGRPELYYMLNERQCLILAGSLKKGIGADEWHDKLVDAFLRERQKARALEVQLQAPVSSAHSLTDTFRPRALENPHRVPDGYFSVMGELFKHLYNLEALFNRSLDEHAMIEISVGLRWARYAREVVGIADQHRCKYAHVCQGGRIELVWAYALHYVTTFDKWLWEVYFPQHFPDYERNLAKYIGLSGPRTRKQLTSPILSWQRSFL
jgi:hypothetical protein